MMAAWRAVFVLASLLAASSATHGYGGYGHHGGGQKTLAIDVCDRSLTVLNAHKKVD